MKLYPVIGMEIHVQLNTKTKLFCRCKNTYSPDSPNTNICPFCTGQPGALPVLNKQAVLKAINFGVAIKANIPEYTRFDRKNYFYVDLPAGYQISQYDNPIVEGGELEFYIENKDTGNFEKTKVGITRAHLEADAGKLIHTKGHTFVDFNRSGSPLIEIVSEPVVTSSSQAMGYVSEMQLLVRTLGISDADMEKGQMRFDSNLSLRTQQELDEGKLPKYKVEIKNINSVRALGRAIEYEIKRQTEILEAGELPKQETRGWKDDLNLSKSQRSKEDAQDYRYFPEPDLRLIHIDPKYIPDRSELPELPEDRRNRFLNMGLNLQTANTFTTQPKIGDLFDLVNKEYKPNSDLLKTIASILTVQVIGSAVKAGIEPAEFILPANLYSLAQNFYTDKINNKGVTKILEETIVDKYQTVDDIIEKFGLKQVSDDTALQAFVDLVLDSNPETVAQYNQGKIQVIGFLVGKCMNESKGKGNPKKFKELLEKTLPTKV